MVNVYISPPSSSHLFARLDVLAEQGLVLTCLVIWKLFEFVLHRLLQFPALKKTSEIAFSPQTLKDKNITILFTFKGLKPCEVEGVGQLTVNSPETVIDFFNLISIYFNQDEDNVIILTMMSWCHRYSNAISGTLGSRVKVGWVVGLGEHFYFILCSPFLMKSNYLILRCSRQKVW